MTSEVKLLHIYGQYSHHDEVIIIGNTEGLMALHKVLGEAICNGSGSTPLKGELMVSDGEGYQILVIREDSNWGSGNWGKIPVPYTVDYAQGIKEKFDYLYDRVRNTFFKDK